MFMPGLFIRKKSVLKKVMLELYVQVNVQFLFSVTKLLLNIPALYFSIIIASRIQEKVSIP